MGPALWIWLASGMAAAAALVILLWAIFSDRPRRRRRCPRCWYDMSAAQGLVCPECGHDARRARRLLKTRRRWKPAAAAIAVLAGAGALALTPHVREHGLLSVVPTHVLALILPREAGERIDYQTSTSVPQYQLAAARELIRRGGASAIPPSMWPRVLLGTGMIDPPATWIEGQPIPVYLSTAGWASARMHVSAGAGPDAAAPVGVTTHALLNFRAIGAPLERALILADPKSTGQHCLSYDVELRSQGLIDDQETVVWRGVVEAPITVIPQSEWLLEPVIDAAIAPAVADATTFPTTIRLPALGSDAEATFWFDPSLRPPAKDLWIELRAEMCIDGRTIPMTGAFSPAGAERLGAVFSPAVFGCELGTDQLTPEDVRVRLRGVPPSSPEGLRARRYWSGHVDFVPTLRAPFGFNRYYLEPLVAEQARKGEP